MLLGLSAPRALVRDLFLRLLGLIFLAAFCSLLVQVTLLFGRHGLLPAQEYLTATRAAGFLAVPTLFWLNASDAMLWGTCVAGIVVSAAFTLNIAPRYCLVVLWVLYLSVVNVGQVFLSFQWDSLLLETALFAVLVAPPGWYPRRVPAPHPIAVFLMLWLLFRLHVESGAAKLLLGDPTWRDLTALVSYYETAPLPTWIGWYAHQMPLWAHRLCTLLTLVVELVVPLFIWGSARVRLAAFGSMLLLQVAMLLTANYGFFNYLTMALALFVLDDRQVAAVAARCGVTVAARPPRPAPRIRTLMLTTVASISVALSIVPFVPLLPVPVRLQRELLPLQRGLDRWRSINAYHLFANMTLIRREVVIEGSRDRVQWEPYEFRYKPGDPDRPPPFVAPHQPRVDFQLWFLLLGGPPRARYFETLLARLFDAPDTVAALFARDPFPHHPPQWLRLAFYRYRFTDADTRRTTGHWWQRELLGYSRPLSSAVGTTSLAPPFRLSFAGAGGVLSGHLRGCKMAALPLPPDTERR